MSEIITVGLDLAKNVFVVHGADASGGGHIIIAMPEHQRSCDLQYILKPLPQPPARPRSTVSSSKPPPPAST
jgi:hypothetical protein